ncbi:glycoside hydrolase family 36 protein [Arthrobacter sp. 260]|uniref:glycoside hydrolase family 36 protein n=1 Tax=Arthrobacter sp. 260 TaxID=2735314 RepID=UPI001491A8F9|nr:glycoside hydrolase family 36 protein [Arthrobacter sp. 260]NOJ58897.1 alpha-galactosidase [Arthrobacter sp. 260]
MTYTLIDEVAVSLNRGRVYEEGWQSWSPTTLYGVTETSRRPESMLRHRMRFRAGAEQPATGFHAEGLLLVDPGTGAPMRVYGAPTPDDIPSIRAELVGQTLRITASGPVTAFDATDAATGLAQFGDRFAATAGVPTLTTPPTAWCSWYRYFEGVVEQDIIENLQAIDRLALPVEVIQLDDGWEAGIGDWTPLHHKFSSLPGLAERIRGTGRRAGIWLAPFIASPTSELALNHPDWLMDEAGFNWGHDFRGLDLTQPGLQDYLWTTFRGLRDDGFDYFKLDFLYGGALPGARHGEATAVDAYRSGLELIRDAVGPDSFLLGCGAPILPSVGLLDGMRVSPDTFHEHAQDAAGELRGAMGTTARAWQHGRFWVNDPDCLVARPTFALREEWAAVVDRWGGLRSSSDRIADLDQRGLELTRQVLGNVPPPRPFAELPGA